MGHFDKGVHISRMTLHALQYYKIMYMLLIISRSAGISKLHFTKASHALCICLKWFITTLNGVIPTNNYECA